MVVVIFVSGGCSSCWILLVVFGCFWLLLLNVYGCCTGLNYCSSCGCCCFGRRRHHNGNDTYI